MDWEWAVDVYNALKKWKKNAFRPKLMEKLQDNLLVPKQVNIALACLKAWRRYAKFRRNKSLNENEIVLLREENLKRQFF